MALFRGPSEDFYLVYTGNRRVLDFLRCILAVFQYDNT